jgi:transposase InsO family protein
MSKNTQVHKRIVLLFMKEVFDAYINARITLKNGIDMLGLCRSSFFRYLKAYRHNPTGFGIAYSRNTANRKLPDEKNGKIALLLRSEKELIQSGNCKVKKFNFAAIALELKRKYSLTVSPETVRRKAIEWAFHKPKKRGVKIYREVETTKIGRLFQHDTCLHQWSPFMEPFYLILTVDDHSRRIVYARFFEKETSMNHILAVRDTVFTYGLPLAYYTDRHSIFTYNEKESYRHRYQTKAEDAAVQWQRVMLLLDIQPILANSPQAKGKVESKFKYLQGRMVRRCAKEEVKIIEHAQRILDEEITYYNEHKKHEVTGQTPKERWNLAKTENRSVLRQCVGQGKDIFCLEYEKKLDAYGKTKVKGIKIQVKKAHSTKVTVRYIEENSSVEIRIWQADDLLKVIKV